tara:strand:- start:55 stop:399 length:345 start_codon:yes stop_codon:yes gene_type:complete
MSIRNSAIRQLAPDCEYIDNGGEITVISGTMPSDEEINIKIQELEAAEPMRLLREERNKRLQETDWWAAGDRIDSMTNEQKIYRKQLRDLPSTASPELDENGQLSNVTWPTKPE